MKRGLIGLLWLLSIASVSQTVNWKLGNPASLIKKGDTFKLIFDYSQMKVDSFSSEENFIETTVGKYNLKEPSRGDKWKKDWFSDRLNIFTPRFELLFSKHIKRKISYSTKNNSSNYVIVVHTTHTYLGFGEHLIYSLVVWAAECDFEISIYKSDNMKEPVLFGTIDHVKGADSGGYYYETGVRIGESYARLGRELGKNLTEHIK
jgi:hypothetical protein